METIKQGEIKDSGSPFKDMTPKERAQVKVVARTLLQNLKAAKLVLHWRKKLRTRADVYATVKTILDDLLAVGE